MQQLLDSIMSEESTEFVFRGKRHSVGWLKKGAVRKFTHITLKEKNDSKRNVKICVVLLLNNIWKIRFFYPFYWRWLYYVCDLDDVEVLRVVDVCKKKIPSAACLPPFPKLYLLSYNSSSLSNRYQISRLRLYSHH